MISKLRINSFINQLLNKAIIKWLITVSGGLSIDLTVFYFLSTQDVSIFLTNFISSGLAVTFVYFMSVKFVFEDKGYGYLRYVLFISYYSISISFYSYCITLLVNEFSLFPLIAKIITLPFSFIINYYCVSKIV